MAKLQLEEQNELAIVGLMEFARRNLVELERTRRVMASLLCDVGNFGKWDRSELLDKIDDHVMDALWGTNDPATDAKDRSEQLLDGLGELVRVEEANG
jgi:hypothetical protein